MKKNPSIPFSGGGSKILQKKAGYRFSIDALLLAHFAHIRPGEKVIDLGTGCGVIPLILIFRRKAEKVMAVEIQPSLADLARRNVRLNRMASRVRIWERDFRQLKGPAWMAGFDVVLANPPYRPIGAGANQPPMQRRPRPDTKFIPRWKISFK
jgi:tRNA1Val (adenine37-N6)-methyltransferase